MTRRSTIPAAFLGVACAFISVASAQQPISNDLPVADNEFQVGATLYTQKAAEFRALAYQAFNLARLRIDEDMNKRNLARLPRAARARPRAIIVDIDETILDNSPAQAAGIRHRRNFNMKDWYAWTEMRKAAPIPGAVEFLNYAVFKGVKVFYVSNRDEVQKQATIDNLRSVGLRGIGEDNVLLRQKDEKGANISTKTPRRQYVEKKYRIVMLIGDNLDDFSDVFERKSVSDRFAETDRYKVEWGSSWIVLPNAMYGTWENAIYQYKAGELTEAQKAEMRAKALEMP
ncbi:MAG TPA: 5'-nucleotidase, lipoprotein e(P4) family [Pyrinomonadaceae bacterium]|nr:5'-nucleotidase, lipoprotein e(P4) family [Pyrinomonadaceae bacterium]